MASEVNNNSQGRLKAEGFPAAPLIEAVMGVSFEGGLSEEEVRNLADRLAQFYPTSSMLPHREFKVDLEAETIEFEEPRSTYRLEGSDETEVALIRPDSLGVSQLAPYRSWELLFERFGRDFDVVWQLLDRRRISRLGVRNINRIDVPIVDDIACYEDYLQVYIRMPESVENIGPYSLHFELPIPELEALAKVHSGVMSPAVEASASFLLDIDVARTTNLPNDRGELLALLMRFREAKNQLYRQFLTDKALAEFEEEVA